MGSTRTALVSCVQTILGFAEVARILSAHGEHLLPGAQGVCRPETSESTGRGGESSVTENSFECEEIKQDIRRTSQQEILKGWFSKSNLHRYIIWRGVSSGCFLASWLWENILIPWSLGFSHLCQWIKVPYLPTSWFVEWAQSNNHMKSS